MRIDPLCNARRQRLLLNKLPNAPRGVRRTSIRFEQVRRALGPLACHVWGQFTPEACWKEHGTILLALPLRIPHLTGLQIDLGEAELDEFRIADASGLRHPKQQHLPCHPLDGTQQCLMEASRSAFRCGG
jgi:hypothetical protein